jgi:cell division protease FtsH
VAPSIIFIDEIDSVGKARSGKNSVGGSDERD